MIFPYPSSLLVLNTDLLLGVEGGGVWKRALSDLASVNENAFGNDALSVYPNPAKNIITYSIFEQQTRIYSVSLQNLQGQKVFESFEENSLLKEHSMDVSAFPKGIYILHIQLEDKVLTGKIVLE